MQSGTPHSRTACLIKGVPSLVLILSGCISSHGKQFTVILYAAYGLLTEPTKPTRSSESDGRSDVTDCLDCPDWFRLPWLV